MCRQIKMSEYLVYVVNICLVRETEDTNKLSITSEIWENKTISNVTMETEILPNVLLTKPTMKWWFVLILYVLYQLIRFKCDLFSY